MPDVPTPEECDLEEDHMLRDSNGDNITARIKHILKLYADVWFRFCDIQCELMEFHVLRRGQEVLLLSNERRSMK